MNTHTFHSSSKLHSRPHIDKAMADLGGIGDSLKGMLASALDFGAAVMTPLSRAKPGWRTSVCCEPKRQHCCDPCLGEVVRTAYVGETIRFLVKIRNKSRQPRTYNLEAAGPLRSAKGDTPGVLAIAPVRFTLGPMQEQLVEARLVLQPVGPAAGHGFQPCTEYRTDIVVNSEHCKPRSVCVLIKVLCEDDAPTLEACCCAGCTNARRVDWYHHFYRDCHDDAGGTPPSTPKDHPQN